MVSWDLPESEVSLLSSAAVTLDALLPTVDENERLPEPSETNASPLDDASPVGNTHIWFPASEELVVNPT